MPKDTRSFMADDASSTGGGLDESWLDIAVAQKVLDSQKRRRKKREEYDELGDEEDEADTTVDLMVERLRSRINNILATPNTGERAAELPSGPKVQARPNLELSFVSQGEGPENGGAATGLHTPGADSAFGRVSTIAASTKKARSVNSSPTRSSPARSSGGRSPSPFARGNLTRKGLYSKTSLGAGRLGSSAGNTATRRLAELEAESKYEATIARLTAERDAATAESAKLRASLSAAEDQTLWVAAEGNGVELDDLVREKVRSSRHQSERLRAQLLQAKMEAAGLRKQNEGLMSQAKENTKYITELEGKHDEFEQVVRTLTEQLKDQSETISDLESQLQKSADFASMFRQLHSRQGEIETTNAELKRKCAKLQGVEHEKNEAMGALENVKDEVGLFERTLAELRGEVRSKSERIAQLDNEIKSATKTIKKLETNLEEAKHEINEEVTLREGVEEELMILEEKLQTVLQEHSSMAEENSRLSSALESKAEHMKREIEKEKEKSRQLLDSTKKTMDNALEEFSSRLESKDKELAQERLEKENLSEQNGALGAKVQEMVGALGNAESGLQTVLSRADEEYEKRLELERAHLNTVDRMTKLIKERGAEVDESQQQNANLKAQLAEAIGDYEKLKAQTADELQQFRELLDAERERFSSSLNDVTRDLEKEKVGREEDRQESAIALATERERLRSEHARDVEKLATQLEGERKASREAELQRYDMAEKLSKEERAASKLRLKAYLAEQEVEALRSCERELKRRLREGGMHLESHQNHSLHESYHEDKASSVVSIEDSGRQMGMAISQQGALAHNAGLSAASTPSARPLRTGSHPATPELAPSIPSLANSRQVSVESRMTGPYGNTRSIPPSRQQTPDASDCESEVSTAPAASSPTHSLTAPVGRAPPQSSTTSRQVSDNDERSNQSEGFVRELQQQSRGRPPSMHLQVRLNIDETIEEEDEVAPLYQKGGKDDMSGADSGPGRSVIGRRPADHVDAMQRGSVMIKFPYKKGKGGKPEKRWVRLSSDKKHIKWGAMGKKKANGEIAVKDIKSIHYGKQTPVMVLGVADSAPEWFCLSFTTKKRSLDLQASSRNVLATWLIGTRFISPLAEGLAWTPGRLLWRGAYMRIRRKTARKSLFHTAVSEAVQGAETVKADSDELAASLRRVSSTDQMGAYRILEKIYNETVTPKRSSEYVAAGVVTDVRRLLDQSPFSNVKTLACGVLANAALSADISFFEPALCTLIVEVALNSTDDDLKAESLRCIGNVTRQRAYRRRFREGAIEAAGRALGGGGGANMDAVCNALSVLANMAQDNREGADDVGRTVPIHEILNTLLLGDEAAETVTEGMRLLAALAAFEDHAIMIGDGGKGIECILKTLTQSRSTQVQQMSASALHRLLKWSGNRELSHGTAVALEGFLMSKTCQDTLCRRLVAACIRLTKQEF